MSTPIPIARVDELPPGHGKIVVVGGCDVAVWNHEGRFYAAAAHSRHVGADQPPGHATPCVNGGRYFDATSADSPALTREGQARFAVLVRNDAVLLFVDEARCD